MVPLLEEVTDFYRTQLSRHHEAVWYLHERGLRSSAVIEHMRIGYAPGRCLRAWQTQLGYQTSVLRQAGLVNSMGNDAFAHRIVFRWKAISMAEASGARHPTCSCRAARAACMDGSKCGDVPRSFS